MVTPPILAIGQVPASMVLGLGDLPAAISFESEAKPIFEKHSVECHAPNILPGKAAESPRLKFVTTDDRDTRMPPRGDLLSAAEGDTGEIGKGLNDYEAIFTERKRVRFDAGSASKTASTRSAVAPISSNERPPNTGAEFHHENHQD